MIAYLPRSPETTVQPADLKDILRDLASVVSASRLNCFHTCRLKFFFRYVLRVEKPTSPALFVGKAVHAVLQAWNLARWRGVTHNPESLREVLETNWANPETDQPVDWKGEEGSQKEAAWALLETYFRETHIPADEKPQGVEVAVEADLAHRGLPKLLGIIDLVRPGGKIVDFKTSGQTPNPERAVHQNELQLTCYGVLYREATGEKGSQLRVAPSGETQKSANRVRAHGCGHPRPGKPAVPVHRELSRWVGTRGLRSLARHGLPHLRILRGVPGLVGQTNIPSGKEDGGMIDTNRRFAAAVLATSALFAACAKPAPPPIVDVRPIGQGLEFLGIALVLAVLVYVFGKLIGGK